MSGISSGIGLVSGINSGELINQLIALDSIPVQNLQQRSAVIDAQRAAFLALSAKLLSAQSLAQPLGLPSFFSRFTSNSSNEDILSATAAETAVPGTYNFRVHSLVTNHAVIARGFADSDQTPIGVGTLSIEVGHGQVNASTDLSALNGGSGVRRGVFHITDRTGETADIDISALVTVDDVLRAINTAGINVRARVTGLDYTDGPSTATGDRIVIEDTSPSDATGNLIVADESDGFAAADLGIVGDVAGSRLDGTDLIQLSMATPLSLLNDGNGVGRGTNGAAGDLMFSMGGGYEAFSFSATLSSVLALDLDKNLAILNSGQGVRGGTIRVTDRAGASVDIELAREGPNAVHTVQEVLDKIDAEASAAGVAISVTVINSYIQITDQSNASDQTAVALTVEDVDGHAAADLGIASVAEGTSISGADIYRVETVGDAARAINFAAGNASGQVPGTFVTARVSDDGNGLHLTLNGANNSVTITALGDSTAAEDLGLLDANFGDGVSPVGNTLETRHLIAGLNTVLLDSLNGGSGVHGGQVEFNVGNQPSPTIVDFTAARTLQDVVDLINDAPGLSLTASINATGNGIDLRTESGDSDAVGVEITDVGDGTTAAELGIAGTFDPTDLGPDGVIRSGNLQLQYITRNTPLEQLRGGRGVQPGSFRITDASGATRIIELSAATTTVGGVVDQINTLAQGHISVEARINDTGDGIVIVDTSGGDGSLSIEDVDGHAAADLRLAGTAAAAETFIDGSYEIRIDVNATDTLENIVAKINAAGGDFSASIVNDGGAVTPFGLTISSQISGRVGALVLDSGGMDLGFETMSDAKDAVATFNGTLITSNTNTLDQVIEGVTINLLETGDEEVTVTVQQDLDGIIQRIEDFVSAYNAAQDDIREQTSFNPETFQRGLLFGDTTVDMIRDRLSRMVLRQFGDGDAVSRLYHVGIRTGTNRNLQFDADKFREMYAEDPESVEALFTEEDTGFGAVAVDTFEQLTRDFDGVLARKNDLLEDQQTVLNDRIDQLNALLAAKRSRLEAEFAGLELALAGLQDQQAALAQLTLLVGR